MSLMLGGMAVTAIVKVLNTAINNGELEGFSGRAYKYEKNEKATGEYIAVNHLPFVHREAVGEGTVNINIHVPETTTHEPNTKLLDKYAAKIASMFPEGTYIAPAYYEFLTDSRPTLDDDKTYYINLQLYVIFNNLTQ